MPDSGDGEQFEGAAVEFVRAALGTLREKLIDTSKRNRLINFKHGERGATFVRVVDELPDTLFEKLRAGELGFDPLPDPEQTPADEKTPEFQMAMESARLTDTDYLGATQDIGEQEDSAEILDQAEKTLRHKVREALGLPLLAEGRSLNVENLARANGFNPDYDLPAPSHEIAEHHSDNKIRVLLTSDQLERKLRGILDRNRTAEAETGIHLLHLAFGFVEWREAPESSERYFAPLLLMPVQLVRTHHQGRYRYRVSGIDEDLTYNLALQELLRTRFGVELAESIEEEDTPQSLFRKFTERIEDVPNLRLRRFVTIGVFPFPRMALWRDLDPAKWPDEGILKHETLQVLLGARAGGGGGGFPSDYPIDDDDFVPRLPSIVLPADVSQHSALIDAMEGKNLVIEGPPGTGKSQTITNLIGAALDRGLRVLFLAEKRAALEVVSSRLDDLGFAPLALELHSDRAKKTEVLKALSERMDERPAALPQDLETKLNELARQRQILRQHIAVLNSDIGATGRSLYRLLWREAFLKHKLGNSVAADLLGYRIPEASRLTELQLGERRDALDAVEEVAKSIVAELGSVSVSPWAAATVPLTQPFAQEQALRELELLVGAYEDLQKAALEFEERNGMSFPRNDKDASNWVTAIQDLPDQFKGIDQGYLAPALRDTDEFRNVLALLSDYQTTHGSALEFHSDPLNADLEQLQGVEEALTRIGLNGHSHDDLLELASRHRALVELLDGTLLKAQRAGVFLGLRSEDLDIEKLSAIRRIFGLLDNASDLVLTLCTPRLLSDHALQLIESGKSDAVTLKELNSELESQVDLDEAYHQGVDRLDEYARVLADTGAFGKLTSGAYRAAKRNVKRLFRESDVTNESAYATLRSLTNFIRSIDAFKSRNNLAELFGSQWSGYTSDFEALENARELAARIFSEARSIGHAEIASRILQEPVAQLRMILAECRLGDAETRVVDSLARSTKLSDLRSRTSTTLELTERIMAHIQGAGIKADAKIQTGVGGVCETISRLKSFKNEIHTIANRNSLLSWLSVADCSIERLRSTLTCAEAIIRAELPAPMLDAVTQSDAIVEKVRSWQREIVPVQQALETSAHKASLFLKSIEADVFGVVGTGESSTVDWDTRIEALRGARQDRDGLQLFANLQQYLSRASTLDTRFVFDLQIEERKPLQHLSDIYELCLVRTLLSEFYGDADKARELVGGATLAQARNRFRELDKEILKLDAKRIVSARLADQVPFGRNYGPRSAYTDQALVRHEIGKQRRHVAIRNLVSRAHNALQSLKPVWLMSPHSVAQFVPPDTAAFDLIIIDEASQMRPEFAIGALARGNQIVVVGDPKQLPPTDFFTVRNEADQDENEDVEIDTESILDLALERFSDRRRLKWHYRSQHPSLIEFSNRQFYEGQLVIFPSATVSDDVLGVSCNYVEGVYEANVNRKEAEAVIEHAVGLMSSRPELSLGIATMNQVQRDLIFGEIERIASEDDTVRNYIEQWADTISPFFVKNLENVQGDERDVVLISTLYGPNAEGHIYQRFGPINSKVGHRRLNVLFTRAKRAVFVVTSLKPADIKATDQSNYGVRALQSYLTYTINGGQVDEPKGGEPESDFEMYVADRLIDAGYEVVCQVGVQGFRIDIGVKHPDSPHTFVAGIECDGATYHSGLTVRDRDRIRQDILEDLGWSIYRIWSTDWFNDPDRETAKMLRWLDDVRRTQQLSFEREAGARDIRSTSPADETEIEQVEDAVVVSDSAAGETGSRRRPHGQHRELDGIDYYEVQRGYFQVYVDSKFMGDVERLGRGPVKKPKIYGGSIVLDKTRYRGTPENSEIYFEVDDLYQAIRRIGKPEPVHTA